MYLISKDFLQQFKSYTIHTINCGRQTDGRTGQKQYALLLFKVWGHKIYNHLCLILFKYLQRAITQQWEITGIRKKKLLRYFL